MDANGVMFFLGIGGMAVAATTLMCTGIFVMAVKVFV
jgi:hypothetical protein